MATLVSSPDIPTLGDLLERLGGIPAERVLFRSLGTATEQDAVDLEVHEDRLCELIGGVLVEKAYNFRGSIVSTALLCRLFSFVQEHSLGIVVGGKVLIRLAPDIVRIPSAAFVSRRRLPPGPIPNDPVSSIVPDLIVEMFNEGCTPREMQQKRAEYFRAGTRALWMVDIRTRKVEVYTSPDKPDAALDESQTLMGGKVLPGFTLELRGLFAELDE